MDVILDAKSIPHLDYCKDLPTASSSLKTVSFGGDVLKPRSDHVTSCLHPDSGPQHKLLWLFKVQKSGALTVLWSCCPDPAREVTQCPLADIWLVDEVNGLH